MKKENRNHMHQPKRTSKLTCFYCPAVLRGPQGRAAHIRIHHPKLPYQPTDEQIRKYAPALPPPPVQADDVPVQALTPAQIVHALHTNTAPMTPREHLATAISNLRSQLEAVQKEISKLESLRAEEATIRYDLEALLKAESAMQENAREVVSK